MTGTKRMCGVIGHVPGDYHNPVHYGGSQEGGVLGLDGVGLLLLGQVQPTHSLAG